MDNLIILMFGLIVFIACLLVGGLLAKWFDWE